VSAAIWEALGTPRNATDAIAAAVRTGGTSRAHAPSLRRPEAANGALAQAHALLTAFFSRYNSQLEPLIQQADPASGSLWRAAAWLPRENVSAAAVVAAAATVRSALLSVGGSRPESAVIGSRRWLGPFPSPSIFLLGARDSGSEVVAEALLGLNGSCGGALRLFDDDNRYTAGLPRALSSLRKGHNASASLCSRVVDTTPYLHTRWAALRIGAALAPAASVRLVVVLRDPAERATRDWRAMRMAASRRGEVSRRGEGRMGRTLGEASGGAAERFGRADAEPLLRYTGSRGMAARAHKGLLGDQTRPLMGLETRFNLGGPELPARLERPAASHANATMLRRARAEIRDIGMCLEQRIGARAAGGRAEGELAGHAYGGAAASTDALGSGRRRVPPLLSSEPSAEDWRFCTTTQCNWLDCLVGTGLYAPQMRGWLAAFPPDQMLLLEASQLAVEPLRVASLVETFLAVPPLAGMAEMGRAAYQGKQALADLRAFYAPHNKNVRRLFDALAPPGAWHLAPWLQAAPVAGSAS
jgi:hypothetical protein